ncbi:hypothetical protein DAPPUDRAFT_303682 [Daphnia pulex]|uniref:Uncharacterized protein n=1 Tax=Daphnia pulex TaxID=6669 RepID=E9GHV1_DAPPU|nr:hypothetical protein DAPPUDRAFT_303682 [Daphnia pulex]|eukprot:EFX80900.1 hypothetical protein DAPPUDRAFT_303682 [Daphnia pulex]
MGCNTNSIFDFITAGLVCIYNSANKRNIRRREYKMVSSFFLGGGGGFHQFLFHMVSAVIICKS